VFDVSTEIQKPERGEAPRREWLAVVPSPSQRERSGSEEFEFREAARRSMMASDLSDLGEPIPPFLRHAYIASNIIASQNIPFLTFALFLFLSCLYIFLSLFLCNLWLTTSLINIRPRSQEHRQVPLWSASRGDPPPHTRPLVTSTHRLYPNLYWATFPQTRSVTLNINGRHRSQPRRATPSLVPTCPNCPARRI
jgi:hypothetical protein